MAVRYESTSLCCVCSQLPPGPAAAAGAWPWRGPEYVQASRVALETVAGLRWTVASLCDQRGLPAGMYTYGVDYVHWVDVCLHRAVHMCGYCDAWSSCVDSHM